MKKFLFVVIIGLSLNLMASPQLNLQEISAKFSQLRSNFKSCDFCLEARKALEDYSENMTPDLIKMSKGSLSVSQIKQLFDIVLTNINSNSEDYPNIVIQMYLANRDKFEKIVKDLAEQDQRKIIESLEDGFELVKIPDYKENYARFKKMFSK